MPGRRKSSHQPQAEIAPLQWVVAAVAVVVVLGSFGLVLYRGLTYEVKPAVLEVQADSITRRGRAHAVYFTVGNRGGSTAASVSVEGAVGAERSSVVLDFVPAGSHTSGVLLFTTAPARTELMLRVTGYSEP